MSILMFEGWDLHSNDAIDIESIGEQEETGYPRWTSATNNRIIYKTDAERGNVAQITRSDGSIRLDSIAAMEKKRIGFWIKTESVASVHSDNSRGPIFFGLESGGPSVAVHIMGGTAGAYTLGIATYSLGSVNDVSTGTGILDGTWRYTEFVVDCGTGDCELWQEEDGVFQVVSTASIGDITAYDVADLFLRSPVTTAGANMTYLIDSIHMTDGESLTDRTETVHAVAVVRSQCRGAQAGAVDQGSSPSRTEGHLYIDGVKYDDGFDHGNMSSLIGPTTNFGANRTNIFYGYFMQNPATSADWGSITITDVVESWGLCRTAGSGRVYVQNMGLAILAPDADGYPEVTLRAPGLLISLTGDWIRTDEDQSWSSHLSTYPRVRPIWETSVDQTQDPFDTESEGRLAMMIASTSVGCITFAEEDIDPDEEEELPFTGVGLTFAEEFRDTYRDWESIDGVGDDFISYFISGYKIHADGNKKFQSNYLTLNYEPDEFGSAFVQGVWDYALGNQYENRYDNNFGNDRSDTGRWGSTQQLYAQTNEQYRHAMRKLKIRGHGKALQFKVKSESGKPFFLNGWIVFVTGNSTT